MTELYNVSETDNYIKINWSIAINKPENATPYYTRYKGLFNVYKIDGDLYVDQKPSCLADLVDIWGPSLNRCAQQDYWGLKEQEGIVLLDLDVSDLNIFQVESKYELSYKWLGYTVQLPTAFYVSYPNKYKVHNGHYVTKELYSAIEELLEMKSLYEEDEPLYQFIYNGLKFKNHTTTFYYLNKDDDNALKTFEKKKFRSTKTGANPDRIDIKEFKAALKEIKQSDSVRSSS
jgi:hypothetical protein